MLRATALAVAFLALGGSTASAKSCGDVTRGKTTAYTITTTGQNCAFARESVARFIKASKRTHMKRKIRHGRKTVRCEWKKPACRYSVEGKKRKVQWVWTVPYNTALASWYEDGGATASGRHATYSVAHKTMSFGTRLEVCFRGCVVAVVLDRGPYSGARELDLNQNVRSAIGFDGVAVVRWRIVR